MIHENIPFGKHTATVVEFGLGSVAIFRMKANENSPESMLGFMPQDPPRPIGDISNDDAGKSSDELDRMPVILAFRNVDGLDALVHSLLELRQNMVEGAGQGSSGIIKAVDEMRS